MYPSEVQISIKLDAKMHYITVIMVIIILWFGKGHNHAKQARVHGHMGLNLSVLLSSHYPGTLL